MPREGLLNRAEGKELLLDPPLRSASPARSGRVRSIQLRKGATAPAARLVQETLRGWLATAYRTKPSTNGTSSTFSCWMGP